MLGFAILGGVIWAAVALAIWAVSRWRNTGQELTPIASRAEAAVDDLLRVATRPQTRERLTLYLQQTGTRWSISFAANATVALFLVTLTAVSLAWRPEREWLASVPALAAAALPWRYLARRRKKRLRKFEEQFADALEFASRALRLGHGLRAAIEMVSQGFGEPLGGEFQRVFEDLNEGTPIEAAISGLAARAPVTDVEFFVSAILVHERTGGSLGETLSRLAGVLRARHKLRARVRTATSRGRATGIAVTAVPLAACGLMYFTDPSHIRFFLDDRTGRLMLISVTLLQACGYFLVRRLMAIR